MRNLMAVVEYDGTCYHGFQAQPERRTVQGELEAALERIIGASVRVAGAGRTDAGAHALAQVVSFRTHSQMGNDAIARAWNALLPEDAAVKEVRDVPEAFHARHSALRRWYRYTIVNREAPPALGRGYAHHIRRPLSVEMMEQASGWLVGSHDFRAFGASRNTVRRVDRANCFREGERVLIDLVANAFLPGMARSIAGTLIRVGMSHISTEGFQSILEQGDRALAGPTAPAKGLCLMAVYYREADTNENL